MMIEALRSRFEACLRALDRHHYLQCTVHAPDARCSCGLHFIKSSLRDNWNQLKQELAAIEHDIERSQERNTALIAENEALRAERDALRALLAEAEIALIGNDDDDLRERIHTALREGK